MGGIYKSTSHIYFYFMIKKRIKKHHLIYLEETHLDLNLTQGVTINYVINQDVYPNVYPNHWQLNLGGEERLHLDSNGDMRITGVMKALGSVRWNQESQILQFWDGNFWVDLDT